MTGIGVPVADVPGAFAGATLQEREAVGVEEIAAVGRYRELVVVNAAVNGSAGGEEPMPGGGAGLEDLGVLEALLLQRLTQRPDGVQLLVVGVVDWQQVVLLGDEEEHHAHHHGDGGFVDLVWLDVLEKGAAPVTISPGDGVDEQLGRPADLRAELVGDLGLRSCRLDEERLGSVLVLRCR